MCPLFVQSVVVRILGSAETIVTKVSLEVLHVTIRCIIQGIALLVDGFLFYRSEGVHLGEALINGVLEEAAADCEYLSHRALGHAVGTGGKGGNGLFGNLAFALGHGVTERSPLQIDGVGVRVELLTTAHTQEAGLYDQTYPVGGRVEAELHEGLGVPATQFDKGLASHQQGPEQQPLNVGSIRVERGFVAGVGLQKSPNGAIAFDGLELIGTTLEEVPNRWKLAIEVKKVKFVEAIKGLEKRLGMRRHQVAQPGLDRCLSGSIEQYPGLVIIGYCNAQPGQSS